MPNPANKTQPLLDFIQSDPNLLKALEALTVGGLLTLDQAQQITGLSEKLTRTTLETLTKPPRSLPPVLRIIPIKRSETAGRPQNTYLPTLAGVEILRSLFPDAPAHSYQVHDLIDVTALCCMLDVYASARKEQLSACVEKVLPYGEKRANVRTDVLVTPKEGLPALFEIEQQMSRNNLPRVVEKLLHLRGLFSSPQGAAYSPSVRVLFNLPADDIRECDTLRAWEDALASVVQQVGELPFSLYWRAVSDFLEHPEWDRVSTFQRLLPSASAPEAQPVEMETDLILPASSSSLDLEELNLALRAIDLAYTQACQAYFASGDPRQRCQHFFSLVSFLYCASHYPGSDTLEFSVFPYKSLFLLHRYLHAHQNQALLEALRRAMPQLQYQASVGIIGFRNALTGMVWDIFLRYHGLARGGPLSAVVQVPDFQDRRSEFYIWVRIANPQMVALDNLQPSYERIREAERALAWVCEALFRHAVELGLSEKQGGGQKMIRKGKGDGASSGA